MAENNDDWDENEDVDQIADDALNAALEEEMLPEIGVVAKDVPEDKFDVIDFSQDLQKASETQKKTLPIMTKYEKAKLIGQRAVQIAKGMPALVSTKGLDSDIKIAERELKEKKTPMIVRRFLPDGTYEDWRVSEFLF